MGHDQWPTRIGGEEPDRYHKTRHQRRQVENVRQKKRLIIRVHCTGPCDEWADSGVAMMTMAGGARRMDMHGVACHDLPIHEAGRAPEFGHKSNADQQIGQHRQPQADPSGVWSHMAKGESVGHMLGVGHHAGSEHINSVH